MEDEKMDNSTKKFLTGLFGTIGAIGAVGVAGYASYLDYENAKHQASVQAEKNKKFQEDVTDRLAELDKLYSTASNDQKTLIKEEITRLIEVKETNNQTNFSTLNHLFDKVVSSTSVVEAIKANKEREELLSVEPEVIYTTYTNPYATLTGVQTREEIYAEIEEINNKYYSTYGEERELLKKVREQLYKKLM
jgi:hypothetical protein